NADTVSPKYATHSLHDALPIWLTTFSLKNNVSVIFLTFIIVIMGVLTYQSLPKDSYPEIKQPTIYVGVLYPGNSPVDMENLVTRDRKSTRLNSSHVKISYAVFC